MSERVFLHYRTWECWRAGFYGPGSELYERDALALLSDAEALQSAMERVVMEWPNTSAQHLSDEACNRRAWLGQAACCIETGAPEHITRRMWFMLGQEAQRAANDAADRAIALWNTRGVRVCQSDLWA